MDRRRFLKYASASATVVGASALGLDYVLSPRPSLGPTNQSTVTLNPMRSTSNQNHPPVANFKYKPYYLAPTDQQTVQFTSNCYDADNDLLSYEWYVDGNRESEQKTYSTVLTKGDHVVRLDVSDGIGHDSVEQTVTVEPDQIYPVKSLHLKYKGISYTAGSLAPEWGLGSPDKEQMDEQLDSIRNDLGCNAVVVDAGADYEDNLIECAELAIEKGFERVYVQPRYMGIGPDETVEKIGKFATRVRALRETSEAVVYSVGHEFGLETAIIEGTDWYQRAAVMLKGGGWDKIRITLPKMFVNIIALCKKNYGYKIAYSAIGYGEIDWVPWENPVFESVGVDAYVEPVVGWTEDWIVNLLSRLKNFGKPVYSMEAGCMTFRGAAYLGGVVSGGEGGKLYDEDEQAGYIMRYCEMLNRARIGGYFYTQYNDIFGFPNGYGLYNGNKRKKGFYMYKSCQRVT